MTLISSQCLILLRFNYPVFLRVIANTCYMTAFIRDGGWWGQMGWGRTERDNQCWPNIISQMENCNRKTLT